MDWKIASVIKAPTGTETHANIVGTLSTAKGEYLYKVSSLPSWRPFWEFYVSEQLRTKIHGIKNFARVVDVQPLLLPVDQVGCTVPLTAGKKASRLKPRNVMMQKIILGHSLSKHIDFGISEEATISVVCQLLAALDVAQAELDFCHFDLHPNNVLLQKMDLSGRQCFLIYELSKDHTVMIPSYGFRAKVIDYEFSHVRGIEGKPFDSRLDLINRCYMPSEFDRCYDVIRLTFSVLSCLIERQKSQSAAQILHELSDAVSSSGAGVTFRLDGLVNSIGDPIQEMMLKSSQGDTKKFLEGRYYHLVAMLMHTIKLPFCEAQHGEDEQRIRFFLDFVSTLLQFSSNPDRCCIHLYDFLSGDQQAFPGMDEFWTAKLTLMMKIATDSLQSLYFKRIQYCRSLMSVASKRFKPIKMLDYLQTRIPLRADIERGDEILWMSRDKRVRVTAEFSDAELEKLNADSDVFIRGRNVLKLLKHMRDESKEDGSPEK